MNIVAWVIVSCEISFWVFILLGLIARYIFGWTRLGLVLLALTPVVDLVLLIVTATDLAKGAAATVAHSIAPLYIGISIAFGKSMIRWADERFVYYIKKQGPKPIRKTGFDHARHSLKGSFHHLLAYVIGAPLLLVTIYWINAPERTWRTGNHAEVLDDYFGNRFFNFHFVFPMAAACKVMGLL